MARNPLHRKKRRKTRRRAFRAPALSVPQVLAWADEHHARTHEWPRRDSGVIPGSLGETWYKVDKALRDGTRDLQGGSSLARLLQKERGVRNSHDLPRLSVKQVLAWCDAHKGRTGHWPRRDSGPVADAPGETWQNVDAALRQGLRGLPGGSSLARLLAKHRGVRNPAGAPPLTPGRILAWADAHHRRTGVWPTRTSGAFPESPGDTWAAVDAALTGGGRGLKGVSSLARLLAKHRGVRNPADPPRLTLKQVLAWADEHHARTGAWPGTDSGPVADAPGENWKAINKALRCGHRGLPGGVTLAGLLAGRRDVCNHWNREPLTQRQILAWADAHHARTGRWPTASSGAIPRTPGDTWRRVDGWLRKGRRGLPGGSSLARLLAERRGVAPRGGRVEAGATGPRGG